MWTFARKVIHTLESEFLFIYLIFSELKSVKFSEILCLVFIYLYLYERQTGNMYKNVKKKIERGVAFPTCISVNNTMCHFSPLASDESVMEEGDILKM